MGHGRDVRVRESDEGVEIEISPVWSRGDLAADAARSGGYYGGILGASGLALTVLYSMTFMPKYGLMEGLRNFGQAFWTALPAVGLYGAPLVVGIFFVAFVRSVWANRSLATPYRIEFDGDTLRCLRATGNGGRLDFEVSADAILEFQAASVDRVDVRSRVALDDPWELTVVTERDVHTFGAGLRESECRRVAQTLEEALGKAGGGTTERGHSAGTDEQALLEFDERERPNDDRAPTAEVQSQSEEKQRRAEAEVPES